MWYYRTKYCKQCQKAHRALVIHPDNRPRWEKFEQDTCECGNPLDKDTTSYHVSEAAYQAMRREIEIILVTDEGEGQ